MTDDDESTASRAKADAILKAVTKAEWERIHKELVLFGFRRTKSKHAASDLAQEAMMRVLDARWEPWDPDRQPILTLFLQSIMNRLLANERKGRKLHREIGMGTGMVARLEDENAPTPEAALVSRNVAAHQLERLRERVETDSKAVAIVDAFVGGADTPEEQRVVTGLDIDDIRNVRRRVFNHAEQVRREMAAEEADALARKAPPIEPPKPVRPVVRIVKRRPAARVPRGARDAPTKDTATEEEDS